MLMAFPVESQHISLVNYDVNLNTVLRDSLVRNVDISAPLPHAEAVFLCGTHYDMIFTT